MRDVPLSELLSEGTVFRQPAIDSFLLSIMDPAGEDQDQELPWLKKGLHISSNAMSWQRESRDQQDRVKRPKNVPHAGLGKSCHLSYLQFG